MITLNEMQPRLGTGPYGCTTVRGAIHSVGPGGSKRSWGHAHVYVSCDSCRVWARGALWPSQLLSPEYWLGDRAKAEAKEKHHRASIPPPAEPRVLASGMKSWPAEMGGEA